MGRFLEALTLIAHKMGDVDKAEAYCRRIFEQGNNRGIFLRLIETYLSPPADSVLSPRESHQPALRVFANHVE